MFLLRRITNKTLCHVELGSASHKHSNKVFNTPSYRANEVRCGIFKKVLRKIPQCVSLMRDDIKIVHTFQKAFAFTLAETLIVMGIIGVVAALTIPNLNSSTADKEKVAKVKKIYSNLNDAIGRMEAVYGPVSDWNNSNTTQFIERFSEFLKISKTCGNLRNSSCMKEPIKDLDGNVPPSGLYANNYGFILADGTSFYISAVSPGYAFIVDIDGPRKGTSTFGKDLFDFYFLIPNETTLTYYVNIEDTGILFSDLKEGNKSLMDKTDLTDNFKSGRGLATWVLQNDNMDYLKATNGTCKNGKVLSWTNTSCK